jgi:two-component system, LytTR family, response regulator LytT
MIKVLIIEDEKPAADYLEIQLKNIDNDLVVLSKLATVRESVEWLSVNRADLIYMDIHLADGNCFRIFEQVEVKTPVIFTTAYDQYAIKAFKVNSIDYLLKPIIEEDLQNSLAKFRELKSSSATDISQIAEVIRSISQKPGYQQRFMVYAGEKIRSVKANEVAFFYITEKEVFLCNFDGRNYGIDYSLDKLEAIVDPAIFFRINRKFIINIEAIETMYNLSGSRIRIILKPPSAEETIVSFHRVSAYKKWLNA